MNRKVHVRFGGGPLEKYPYGQLAGGLSYLTLPPDLARSLGLPLLGSRYVTLANGVTASLDVYRVTVLWEGAERLVRTFASDGSPLVGMALLHGSEVRLRVVDGGSVVIEPLP